ncbi:MAG: response regulator, partial [Bacteroidia bacterium]|nr:response regulator [Bacteroidia bacterium]
MMTTSSSDVDIRSAYEKNIAGYLTKPVDLNDVMSTFENLKNYWKIINFPPPKD